MLSSVRAHPQRGADTGAALGIQVVGGGGGEVRIEAGEPFGDGVEVTGALVRRRGRRIARARIIGDLRPPSRRPRPPLAEPGNGEAPRAPVARLAQWEHEVRRDVLDETRLELTRVIARLDEKLTCVEAGVPVH